MTTPTQPKKRCHTIGQGSEPTLIPLLVSKKQAAFVLGGISLRSVGYLISSGRLRTRRIGGRTMIHYSELQRFVKEDQTEPMAA
jgi:hypothetical protein